MNRPIKEALKQCQRYMTEKSGDWEQIMHELGYTRSRPEMTVEMLTKLLHDEYKKFHGFVADYPSENNHKFIGIFRAQAAAIHAAMHEKGTKCTH